jgi:hypothetical protein
MGYLTNNRGISLSKSKYVIIQESWDVINGLDN